MRLYRPAVSALPPGRVLPSLIEASESAEMLPTAQDTPVRTDGPPAAKPVESP